MIWLHPAALTALVAIAGPIVAHILVRQRALRIPFPTLRFIQPHRLASVRRRALEDAALLIVRVAIVAFAAAAVAGPFLVTDARRRQWDARVITAEVVEPDLRSGIVRAVAWLERQRPGRREIVVRAPFALGSLSSADVSAIPAHIGLRFERTGSPPSTRTLPGPAVIVDKRILAREVTLSGERTSVRDLNFASRQSAALQISAPADQQAAAAALEARIGGERLPAPVADRTARIAFGAPPANAAAVREPWMIASAARIANGLGRHGIDAIDADVRFGADGSRLVVSTRISAADPAAFPIVQTVAQSLAADAASSIVETATISDADLRAWSRAPGPAPAPAPAMIDRDDRRWLWGAALILLLFESVLRRTERATAASEGSIRAA